MASGQVSQTQSTDPHADKFLNFIPNLVKHPTNLPINSLMKNDSQTGDADRFHFVHAGSLAIECHSGEQLGSEAGILGTVQRYFVFLLNLMAWMG